MKDKMVVINGNSVISTPLKRATVTYQHDNIGLEKALHGNK